MRPSYPTPREMKTLCLHKELHVNVYSKIILNSQKLETTQMFIKS